MDIVNMLGILSESLLNVCLIATVIVVLLAIIAFMSKGNIIRKTTAMLGRLVLLIWFIQIGCSIYYLLNGIQ
ncbi:hypothetical protein [Oceanirhabdus sp. W0125-5]|uniref:hypothetical protein n=1 Tax=Oceanirhabdus sp. W0125-5 TaxID=2999116 RepID=UPI0022F2B61A|nr:hypothetical protein [Oceanirhabdus sp. W0125-5]WBW97641.1 hypothetical protein OW730_02360 [Oceanirhabdus sp. W0125-5]